MLFKIECLWTRLLCATFGHRMVIEAQRGILTTRWCDRDLCEYWESEERPI